MGGKLKALALAPEVASRPDALFTQGADVVIVSEEAGSQPATLNEGIACLTELVSAGGYRAVLVGGTRSGNEAAARLAHRLGVSCATDCLSVQFDGSNVVVERNYYGGRFLAKQAFLTSPAVLTIPPRRFEPLPGNSSRRGEVLRHRFTSQRSAVKVLEQKPRTRGKVEIEKAEVVVSAGRGVKKKEDLRLVEELAKTIGGEVAGSRPLTEDLKWLPVDVQVGLSGKKVKPRLYLACGISGQIQHVVGMREAKVVVAINTDAQAPILQEADYYVVGDLYKVVPLLTAAFKQLTRK